MRQLPRPLIPATTALMLLSLTAGCSQLTSSRPDSTVEPVVTSPIPSPVVTTTTPSPIAAVAPSDAWENGLERAASAANLAESAQSRDDWALVSSRWQQAIALLQRIPETDPNHAEAQSKLAEFQRSFAAARQRANSPIPNVVVTAPVGSPSPEASASPGNATSEAALATHLSEIGATLYSSSNCEDCQKQWDLFGAEAASKLSVVDCSAQTTTASPNPNPCRQANVSTYPTWQINNQLYPGPQSLEQLATLSNYQGPRDFRS